jgi:HSP20 family protein
MDFRHDPFTMFFNELEKMMMNDFPSFYAPNVKETKFLPYKGESSDVIPYKRPSLDVKEENDEIAVFIDLPGVDKENIKLRLVNPRTLEVSCEKGTEYEDKKENYYIKERTYGYMKRMVSLPSDVTELDMKSSYKNGVLDLKFKKSLIAPKEYLRLE